MSRPNGVFKLGNSYQGLISRKLYEETPKAVFAAIAVSFLLNHQSINEENIDLDLLSEWRLLFDQNIIPQRPPKL